ncbi:helix-turn-helix domain-containing protein [Myroides sp. LJL119]
MKVSLYHPDLPKPIFEKANTLANLGGGIYVKENTSLIDHLNTKGIYREIFLDGIHIGFGDIKAKAENEFFYTSNVENIEMHFTLKGQAQAYCNSGMKHLLFDFTDNTHNILYSKKVDSTYRHTVGDFSFFEIKFNPSYFLEYLDPGNKLDHNFLQAISQQRFTSFVSRNYPISAKMLSLIKQIITCNRQGIFKKLYLKAKITQLLLLQLEQFNESRILNLSSSQAKKVIKVKEFIDSNLDSKATLRQLATMVGSNEYTLKKVFKQQYDTTVFQYWNQKKMNKAKELLQSNTSNINEVAFLVGYQNPRHFSTAFKNYYGYSPSELLRENIKKD